MKQEKKSHYKAITTGSPVTVPQQIQMCTIVPNSRGDWVVGVSVIVMFCEQMVILPLKRILMCLWHKETGLSYTGGFAVLKLAGTVHCPWLVQYNIFTWLSPRINHSGTFEKISKWNLSVTIFSFLLICLLSSFSVVGKVQAPICFSCCCFCCFSGLCWKMFWSMPAFYLLMLQWIGTLAGQFTSVALQYSNIGRDHLNTINIWHLSTD